MAEQSTRSPNWAQAGYWAPIKKEYIFDTPTTPIDTKSTPASSSSISSEETNNKENEKKKKSKSKTKNQKSGHNRIAKDPGGNLCISIIHGKKKCDYGEKCKFSHDIDFYLANKQPDLDGVCPSVEQGVPCPFGIKCRFFGKHPAQETNEKAEAMIYSNTRAIENNVINILSREQQQSLRKRKAKFPKSGAVIKALNARVSEEDNTDSGKQFKFDLTMDNSQKPIFDNSGRSDKQRVDFKGKLYLAPLTTVGNLPFRRICKEYGVDITCGEMAMAANLLKGHGSEWALLKRHKSEDIFGVQLAGAHPDQMTRAAEYISENCDIDFIDINCGCPIDLVCHQGAGSALLGRPRKLRDIIQGMRSVLVDTVSLTIKVRTGLTFAKQNTIDFVPKFKSWGIDMLTVHGRTRAQRYTRDANWDYVNKCANATDLPVFGNGDILGWQDVRRRLDHNPVSGVMLARGALIKPWIFTEIKESRDWDISSHERFEMIKKFCRYGLEHWGSDQSGVEKTRRFLLEWQSFMCRYIPVGLLERLPQKIGERPPPFKGRNDLETLLSSTFVDDWIKISTMLLGPVPNNFYFEPKHKSNSYRDSQSGGQVPIRNLPQGHDDPQH
eukprot:UC4_evm3s1200